MSDYFYSLEMIIRKDCSWVLVPGFEILLPKIAQENNM